MISQDLKGLHDYHQDLTGYSSDQLLLISLLINYPDLLQLSGFHACLPVVLSKYHQYCFSSLGYLPSGLLKPQPCPRPDQFPDQISLVSFLSTHPLFSHFPPEQQYPALLESLIILMHFSLQPQNLMAPLFNEQSDHFSVFYLCIDSASISDYIEVTQSVNHTIRKIEFWLTQRVMDRYFNDVLPD
ncbi:MAG: hypothetical protein ACXAE3_07520 [Candidatus Kariarchaeaceae archaeon]|jgi:hypothetical protein